MSESKPRVLVVDDDRAVRDSLRRSLEFNGYEVVLAADGAEGLVAVGAQHPDVVVIDVMMPRLDGIETTRALRAAGNDVPVLVLTARDAVGDRVEGLDAGADDYLTKPFLPQELVVRLRALARRARGQAAQPIHCDDLSYYPTSGEFRLQGEPLKLTAFEHRILCKLFQYQGSVVTRERLIDALYGENDLAPDNALEVMIGRIRRKIGADKLLTLRGQGYSLAKGGE